MKAKFGAIVVDGRGKAGGHVFSKNRGGSYMRTKVTPSNPQSASQQSTRASLTRFAQGFRALTAEQIAGWNAAVENFKSTNIFGDIKNPSGINLYVRLNTLIILAGGTALTSAPLPTSVSALTALSAAADVSSTSFDVTFAPTPIPANHSLIIEATKQSSPGVSAFKGKATVIQVEAAAATSPADIYAAYVAKYGALVAGQKIEVRAYFVNKLTGQKGTPLTTSVLVTA
jgi:hypothetical protein